MGAVWGFASRADVERHIGHVDVGVSAQRALDPTARSVVQQALPELRVIATRHDRRHLGGLLGDRDHVPLERTRDVAVETLDHVERHWSAQLRPTLDQPCGTIGVGGGVHRADRCGTEVHAVLDRLQGGAVELVDEDHDVVQAASLEPHDGPPLLVSLQRVDTVRVVAHQGDPDVRVGKERPVKARTSEERRVRGRLTITNALDEEQRQRSLASLKRHRERQKKQTIGPQAQQKIQREVVIPEAITIQELANRMAERGVDVIKFLMKDGEMHKITDVIDADTAQIIAEEFGHIVRRVSEADVEEGFIGADDLAGTPSPARRW